MGDRECCRSCAIIIVSIKDACNGNLTVCFITLLVSIVRWYGSAVGEMIQMICYIMNFNQHHSFSQFFFHFSDYLGGWLTFVCSICMIGLMTMFIGDLASHFGCSVGLTDAVTAITFVALGTSLPGKFWWWLLTWPPFWGERGDETWILIYFSIRTQTTWTGWRIALLLARNNFFLDMCALFKKSDCNLILIGIVFYEN